MDLLKKSDDPPGELLIDLGDSSYHPSGFKFDYAGADYAFNAEEAILDVFGSFFNKPDGGGPVSLPSAETCSLELAKQPFEIPQINKEDEVTTQIRASLQQPASFGSVSYGNHHDYQAVLSLMSPPFNPHLNGFGGPIHDGFGGPVSDSFIGSRSLGGPSSVRFDSTPISSFGGFGRAPPSAGFGSRIGGEFGSAAAPASHNPVGGGFEIEEGPGTYQSPVLRGFGVGNKVSSGFGNRPIESNPGGGFGSADNGFSRNEPGTGEFGVLGGSDLGGPLLHGPSFGEEDRGFGRETCLSSSGASSAFGGVCFGSSSSSTHPKEDPVLICVFDRTNEDIDRLPSRPRSGRSGKGLGRGSRRSGKRGGRGRGSLAAFLTSESPSDVPSSVTSSSDLQKEKSDDLCGVSSKRPPSFGERQNLTEAPHKRRRVSCKKCGRLGHKAEVCYSTQNKGSLRCYNCNQIGHLSVRCMLPRASNRGIPRGRAPNKSSFRDIGLASTPVSNNQRADPTEPKENNGGGGIELIWKLMQDPQVRSDMERSDPVLHDNILVYMLKHVQL